ncbi:uncharacterized protein YjiS (DUF1127 family) [Rhizobium skierniewicense]|uniref:Uncharacterized protein YjiS (DUF1127 family) n=1 Tax=Rhizobium skierniewicense TaxID=984260 RepID=A0A7W6G3L5_9HYPH|nr:DUF1127 domain-containing protein [Rhizobium skierniewicense]MBB3947960.1 uncharacterized protein YjiS (DUF1127 family) [Rhizobium skierniewicense]NTF31982.1 DUF1127 domain-containing protein [Rhizobium skierniewicense]
MLKMDQYNQAIDTMYPDGYQRERMFRDSGDMVDPKSAVVAQGVFGRLIAVIGSWQSKRSGRLALRELANEQLHDIGVTREQALREAQKALFSSWLTPPR